MGGALQAIGHSMAQAKRPIPVRARRGRIGSWPMAAMLLSAGLLALQGCFSPVYPTLDREERVLEALARADNAEVPLNPLGAADAVAYALRNNLEARVAELEAAYQNESAVAARRRLLPSLTLRYSLEHLNHPSARSSESVRSHSQSLESSYSSEPATRRGEVGVMWNVLDFGVGYLKTRQQRERALHATEQRRRVRQQIVLDVLTQYWRAAAASGIAEDAAALEKELKEQVAAIHDSVDMRILSSADGARRELAVHGSLAELDQLTRMAAQAKLELARAMGCANARDLRLAEFPSSPAGAIPIPDGDPSVLQTVALQRRPELFQHDSQERIAVDDARLALLQMAPNANISMSLHDDPDKFLEWNNWMSLGARVSWNLFAIPARLSERRMARLQQELAHQKGLAMAAAVLAQVGIAYSDWRLWQEQSDTLFGRVGARERLVEALAAGEADGQTRPGEVLIERVRLLGDKAAAMRAGADARVAAARLANAVGLDVDDCGRLIWNLECDDDVRVDAKLAGDARARLDHANEAAEVAEVSPMAGMTGLRVVSAEEFLAPDEFFVTAANERAGTEAWQLKPEDFGEREEWYGLALTEESEAVVADVQAMEPPRHGDGAVPKALITGLKPYPRQSALIEAERSRALEPLESIVPASGAEE